MTGSISAVDPGAPVVGSVAETRAICEAATIRVVGPDEPKTDSNSETKDAGTAVTVGVWPPDIAKSDDNCEISDEDTVDTGGVLPMKGLFKPPGFFSGLDWPFTLSDPPLLVLTEVEVSMGDSLAVVVVADSVLLGALAPGTP